MDVPGILERPADAVPERSLEGIASRTTLRMDWVLALLSVWLIGGFYIDIWAHAHGQVDDTFFTPWHAMLYAGAASFGVVLGAAAILGRPRSVPLRGTLAPPYRLAFIGFLLFGAAGVLDLAWHAVVGFEVDVESLLSPSHLLLATAGLLMVGSPIRAAGARLLAGAPRSWRTAGPLVVGLAMAVAVLVAFTQYANPIVDTWAAARPADEPQVSAQLYAMSADGSGQRRLTVLPGGVHNARFSPDGSQIAYSYSPPADAENPEPMSEIHVMNADGSGDRVIPTEVAAADPAWSPDGTRLAFAGVEDGEYDVYVTGLDGSGYQQLTDDSATDFAITWTPDGSALLFNSDRDGNFDIYRLELSTQAAIKVIDGPSNDHDPAVSPDGTRIAFTSDRRGSNHYDVWIASIDGSSPERLTVGADDEVGDSYMPAWSPDGSRIAFTSNRTDDFEVYVMPASGGEATNLSRNPATSDGWARPDWSPDGASILYPSEGNLPFWRVDYVRQGFGAAGVLVAATILAGAFAWLRRRFGSLPLGAYGAVVGVPLAMATVMSDQFRLLPGIVLGAVAVELVVRRWPARRSRVGDALVAFLVPAIVFALYFATLAVTGGIGWTLHLWLGAIVTAGIIGLFVDELTRAGEPSPAGS